MNQYKLTDLELWKSSVTKVIRLMLGRPTSTDHVVDKYKLTIN